MRSLVRQIDSAITQRGLSGDLPGEISLAARLNYSHGSVYFKIILLAALCVQVVQVLSSQSSNGANTSHKRSLAADAEVSTLQGVPPLWPLSTPYNNLAPHQVHLLKTRLGRIPLS